MAATQLIRTWRPSSAICAPSTSQTTFTSVKMKCSMSNAIGFSLENNRFTGDGERKPVVIAKAAACSEAAVNRAVDAPMQTRRGLDVVTLVAIVRPAVVRRLLLVTRSRSWRSIVQLFIEKIHQNFQAIIDCRFFTLFAIAGTLLGSVLCFLEYFQSDHGHIMQLLIESLGTLISISPSISISLFKQTEHEIRSVFGVADMFLVGTAMLVFGMGLHVMFVGSQGSKSQLHSSNFFGIFHLKENPSWVGMKSVIQAKSMIGYALMLLLQVGVLEKFKSIPLVTGLDLACFAGAVFVSSAGLFILSKLSLDS
ncbi:Uncharacterized protein family UPF0114 [Cynara cardunculus var. scolymus]|uniref:Uncharacterized protein family UPF0114 n=1 Tax=Cynara cardunculus var. scolymus TaxID=59895 RepID=A0A103XWV4_CYNCS|nr:Uncharacterized protein family UPF0114 [Cynara cardunculus var. scolymus]